jgi:alkylation response protein AidB-like acyl-CoA dehydrogenase
LSASLTDDQVADLVSRSEFPEDLWQFVSDAGLLRLGIDEKWGGESGGIVEKMQVAEILSQRVGVLSWVWGITTCFAGPILQTLGSEDLKAQILPELVQGKARFAFGVSEPAGGSDLFGALSTTYDDGRLNGVKRWCTASLTAHYLIILARDAKVVGSGTAGLTLCVVDRHAEGMSFQRIPTPSFASAIGTYQVEFDNVPVMEAWQGPNVKEALRVVLMEERLLIPGIVIGAATGALERSLAYAKTRYAFGNLVDSYQGLQHQVADAVMDLETSRHYSYEMAHRWSRGEDVQIGCDVAKSRSTTAALHVADVAVQMMGGIGFTGWGGVEHIWRDLRAFQLAPITEELVRNRVARFMGMSR